MKSPRSRNFRAQEDGLWDDRNDFVPEPESCPHCLNRGGSLARCGITGEHNYDHPRNTKSGALQWSTQQTYAVGSAIDIDTVITAHHKGHIEVKACPMADDLGGVPTQACFDAHPLEFLSDELYGAPRDGNYPGRAYLAPPEETQRTDANGISGIAYKFKFRLPPNVSGYVLLQWYYITGNSCTAPGYSDYQFPDGWTNSAPTCDHIPSDGIGVPEQFWNCGEVFVGEGEGGGPSATPAPPTPSTPNTPPVTVTPAPMSSPTPAPNSSPTPVSNPNPAGNPTKAPSPITTGGDPICPTGFTGLVKASDTCSHFQYCVAGSERGDRKPCPDGLLFDESKQVCNHDYSVWCNGTPPEGVPLCPGTGYTGMIAVDDCSGFRFCDEGVIVSPKQSCGDGLTFDESVQNCNYSSNTTCGSGSRRTRSLRGSGSGSQ